MCVAVVKIRFKTIPLAAESNDKCVCVSVCVSLQRKYRSSSGRWIVVLAGGVYWMGAGSRNLLLAVIVFHHSLQSAPLHSRRYLMSSVEFRGNSAGLKGVSVLAAYMMLQ